MFGVKVLTIAPEKMELIFFFSSFSLLFLVSLSSLAGAGIQTFCQSMQLRDVSPSMTATNK